MRIQQHQSCCFASSFLSIGSVSAVQYRIGVKNLLNRFQILIQPVQGNLVEQHNERFEQFAEDIPVCKPSDDAGFIKKGFSWTLFGDNS